MAQTDPAGEPGRRPAWLRKSSAPTAAVLSMERRVAELGLHTVCQSARCPNLGECFSAGTATFLILGNSCTRRCGFCAVDHAGPVGPPDPDEGRRIAAFMRAGGIRFAVVTSVTRDDLPDGGAGHFALVAREVKAELPGSRLEVLIPDFGGSWESLHAACAAPIDVLGHNVETVPRLYSLVRPGASYERSLGLLEAAKRREARITKSGIMVGIGEERAELPGVFGDLASIGLEILTIGQYLRPTGGNLAVARYYAPEEFEEMRAQALEAGIPVVVAGPYVRSSYLAEHAFLAADGEARLRKPLAGEKGV
jgi:lipoic acid synthetase